MRIPITAAKSLLEIILANEFPVVSQKVLSRLSSIDLDKSFLEESSNELSRVQGDLLVSTPSVKDWPGLSGEFAALFSWLLQDLKSSDESVLFDKAIFSTTLRSLDQLGVKSPYHSELLKVNHWVVGACWSKSHPQRSSALVFPLKPTSLDREQAGIAYNGLIRHLQTLEALGLNGDPDRDLEMAISSIAVRVVGLAQSLNPEFGEEAYPALDTQLRAKFARPGRPSKVKDAVKETWTEAEIWKLIRMRNSIAHVSIKDPFSETVSALTEEVIHKFSELATTMMASEILYRLESVSGRRVLQWLNQFRNQLENQNLIPLHLSLPAQFRIHHEVDTPNHLVTPLG